VSEVEVRPYRESDEEGVLALLDEALVVSPAGGPPSELFRWKHLENPFGRSHMLVARAEGKVVGLRAFMRWEFVTGSHRWRAVRAVDTATAPGFQGRGIFSRLTRAALDAVRGEVDLVFNTPNEQSGPGYLKMGWRTVGRIPVRLRVRRPLRFIRGLRSVRTLSPATAPPLPAGGVAAGELLREAPDLMSLLEETERSQPRLRTRRTLEFLQWRYGGSTRIDYRAVAHQAGGRMVGVALFRVRPRGRLRECSVTDLVARPGDAPTIRALVRQVLRSTVADHVLAVTSPRTLADRAMRRSGFLSWRGGPVLMVNPLTDGVEPDPMAMRSWDLSLGDIEVF
jgi:GNAT superfamily N-acetyltransferase